MSELISPQDVLTLRILNDRGSVREVANAIGVKSANTAHARIQSLIQRGYVIAPKIKGQARSWELTEAGKRQIALYAKP